MENKNNDCTDGILDTLHNIEDSTREEFEELIGIESNKKTFVRNLRKLFTIPLNINYNTAEKIKRIIKIAIETTLKLWPESKRQ